MILGKRRSFNREISHKSRLVKLVLVEMLPQMFDEFSMIFHIVAFNSQLVCERAQMFNGRFGSNLLAQSFGKRAVHGHSLPFSAQIVFRAVVESNDSRTECVNCGILNKLLGQIGNRIVVSVCLIRFNHGKFRRMSRVRTLISEVAVNLKNTLDSAHKTAFKEQFRRDSQV